MNTIRGQHVAEGVTRFGTKRINWYVVEEDGALTIIDAGLPGHWDLLIEGIDALGYTLADIEAVLVTHGDLDHIGFAEWLRKASGASVWIHPADVKRANTMSRSLPPVDFLKNLWRPPTMAYFVEVVRSGVGSVPPLTEFEVFENGDQLDVPGHPTVIHVPGHTAGSSAFYLPDRGVLFCGDALMTLNVRTGEQTNPTVLPPIHYDAEKAWASIRKFESCGEVVLLSGHGEPWSGDMAGIV
ncbi:MBL fold metallo-hydrolase [Haloferax sp. MBLA0076]|uniref:MBL fold metallo-hydrolase n=1 Tax=Haloferax litoreum TaxID=2666140 RepID=A0A6A8GL04_9EURY|nr:MULTISPECIES: MBL fold metallo-hydrolase [Haloferax]KAB1193791.1 MBL fold metallo-hydrolase [Haloferax sp. CBA1148]MRX22330.1 MBL fold metallo-hydrolase [Haloferax litoreum]